MKFTSFIYIKFVFADKVYIKSEIIFVFYNEINDFSNYFAYKIIKSYKKNQLCRYFILYSSIFGFEI